MVRFVGAFSGQTIIVASNCNTKDPAEIPLKSTMEPVFSGGGFALREDPRLPVKTRASHLVPQSDMKTVGPFLNPMFSYEEKDMTISWESIARFLCHLRFLNGRVHGVSPGMLTFLVWCYVGTQKPAGLLRRGAKYTERILRQNGTKTWPGENLVDIMKAMFGVRSATLIAQMLGDTEKKVFPQTMLLTASPGARSSPHHVPLHQLDKNAKPLAKAFLRWLEELCKPSVTDLLAAVAAGKTSRFNPMKPPLPAPRSLVEWGQLGIADHKLAKTARVMSWCGSKKQGLMVRRIVAAVNGSKKIGNTKTLTSGSAFFSTMKTDLLLWGFASRPNVKTPGAEVSLDRMFMRMQQNEDKTLCMMTDMVATVQLLLENQLVLKVFPVLGTSCPVATTDINACTFGGNGCRSGDAAPDTASIFATSTDGFHWEDLCVLYWRGYRQIKLYVPVWDVLATTGPLLPLLQTFPVLDLAHVETVAYSNEALSETQVNALSCILEIYNSFTENQRSYDSAITSILVALGSHSKRRRRPPLHCTFGEVVDYARKQPYVFQ